MGAAGVRVGWIIAGRDNLWAGSDQRERSIALEYGYKDIVSADRGLSINFNAGDIGAFTLSDIAEYFALLRKQVQHAVHLPKVSKEDAKRLLEVTQGVPLAVKIAAGLYLERADLDVVTEKVEGKREIIDQMVRRYLLHTGADQGERARLYGLALLRRVDVPAIVATAIALTSEQASTMYASELSRLHRRYSFIFTMKEVPSLHQEVRHFLRLWLLEHRTEPEITAINERLCKMQETVLQNLENNRTYGSLRARLEDEEWIGIYLDLIEQQCWLDVGRAMLYILPFIIAAAFYAEYAAFEVIKAMEFFQADLKRPYREWWLLVTQMLLSSYSSPSSIEEHIVELKALERLISVEALSFPSPPLNKDYHQELEALVWYKLGMTYQGTDDTEAASWYEQALTQVNEENKLRENIARQYVNMTIKHHNKRMYDKCLPLLDRAIAIKPDFFDAYYHRADIYVHLKQYQRALLEIEQVFVLLRSNAGVDKYRVARVYNIRGNAYKGLKEFQYALEDYNHAIQLDPRFATAYNNRAAIYLELNNHEQTLSNIDQALKLNPRLFEGHINRATYYTIAKNI